MPASSLVKGSLFVRERAIDYKFMFNPAELEVTKEVIFPKDIPAGGSNPIYNYAAGGERLITFTLYLDGDRGRSEARPRFAKGDAPKAASGDEGTADWSVMPDVNLLQSLLYPSQYGQATRDVYPYVCLFSFGQAFKAVPVIVKKADAKLLYFLADLTPTRATVSMQLGIIKPAYETADEFVRDGQSGNQRYRSQERADREANAKTYGGPSGYSGRYIPILLGGRRAHSQRQPQHPRHSGSAYQRSDGAALRTRLSRLARAR